MANIKISELNSLAPPAPADELPVVDVSATSTKKTTVGEVVGIINGDVEVASNGTATISELPVSKLQDGTARQLLQTDAAGTGVEWTSNVDVPGTLDVTGAVTFDSTADISGDVTITDKIIHSGDTDTAIRFPAEDTFAVETGGSERARIDDSGRLLVGTSTAGSSLTKTIELHGAGTTTSQPAIQLYSFPGTSATNCSYLQLYRSRGSSVGTNTIVASGDRLGMLRFIGANGTGYNSAAEIYAEVDGTPGASSDMPGRLVFSTTADGASSPTERMRITSDGDVLIGTTGIPNGTSTYGAAFEDSTNNRQILKTSTSVTTAASLIAFYNGNGIVGSISVSGSATAYNTSSDYRLKENVVPLIGAVDRLNQLQVRRFNFIADPDTTVDGFIAHEAQFVVPECVTGTKDEVDADGNPVYQGIDQSKLVPLLTAALQEAIGRIETLEAEIAALKGV